MIRKCWFLEYVRRSFRKKILDTADFANILFAGPCNRFCPFCIGKEVAENLNASNLSIFPPLGWQAFVAEVKRLQIGEVVFTGTTTDPHLYRYEAQLIDLVRADLPQAKISIHTNGALSLKKIKIFNRYDRACISLPTLNPQTYARMMGVPKVPDLRRIIEASEIPVKVSSIINEHNVDEVDLFLKQLSALGVKRVVLRRLFGDLRQWKILPDRVPVRYYRKNPVYEIDGLEVTWWNFDETASSSINLFADGTLSKEYLLVRAPAR
ncbi:Radical SAM domain protein [Turneriella parva DSM 21527]|uniref:Radical SAM domain protein n=1 Tax=Turneriella parva (strain ATCC BAA-1111 / DSM 21527 / NCTC 11395 / H) TaxID=869212 RepID=I4BA70_TURPD|nr:Radical SAM domain protein [Turneriella parva DSM 21527]